MKRSPFIVVSLLVVFFGVHFNVSAQESAQYKVQGYIMLDHDIFDPLFNENNDESGRQTEIRRARLALKTKWNEDWQSKFQVDITDGIEVKDAYLQYQGWKWLDVRVGQFKEPFGFEYQSGSRNLATIERSMSTDSLSPGRNPGVMVSGEQSSINWQLGYFQQENTEKGNGVTARFAWAPIDTKQHLFHMGLAMSKRSLHGEEFRINQTLEVSGADSLFEGDRFYADNNSLLGAELAWRYKGLLATAEWQESVVVSTSGENYKYQGGYLQLSYLFSGKQRSYSQGSLGKVKADNAWEVGARYSLLDLLKENELADTYTLGVNYYLNKDTKLSLGYTKAEHFIDNLSQGTGNAISFRLQYSF
jgi:phosphate-selective porin OprO/OprP